MANVEPLHIDTANSHPDPINTRLAYVAVSRARFDVQILTDNAQGLTESLGHEAWKSSANGCEEHLGQDAALISSSSASTQDIQLTKTVRPRH